MHIVLIKSAITKHLVSYSRASPPPLHVQWDPLYFYRLGWSYVWIWSKAAWIELLGQQLKGGRLALWSPHDEWHPCGTQACSRSAIHPWGRGCAQKREMGQPRERLWSGGPQGLGDACLGSIQATVPKPCPLAYQKLTSLWLKCPLHPNYIYNVPAVIGLVHPAE